MEEKKNKPEGDSAFPVNHEKAPSFYDKALFYVLPIFVVNLILTRSLIKGDFVSTAILVAVFVPLVIMFYRSKDYFLGREDVENKNEKQ